ncbi:DUF2255 family protein [Chryseobacterium vrystaatense]|uniref:DUF2255 family protein n=1 Tax=Chryseobacterium vrystaatense TaxID=307480 RepID=A0A1M5E1V4_9FLAO|nr:DUF2255 family protein [Chryseobacterium vrystaatense]SHF73052.1 hypothetical protein SAMN02787073_2783 [Chryseobacterium vrystaatense]
MNKDKALHFINTHNITEIKAGGERTTFLEIWMVTVNDRIFARSWGLAERSWYNTFLKNPSGQIRCGEEIFNIKAVIPTDIKDLNFYINTAYLTKYNTGKNIRYSKAIVEEKHAERTMEFIICE